MAIKLTSTTLTKNLVKRTKLIQHLDRAFENWDETDFVFTHGPKGKDDAFHPSGDCTPSINDLYDKVIKHLDGEDTFGPISASLRKTFMVGHYWHAILQHLLVHELGFATPESIECRGAKRWGNGAFHWATGSADVAPCAIPKHGDWIVDFKTMNGRVFAQEGLPNYTDNHGYTTGQKWEAQVNIYMDWFDLEHGLIVGVNKDSPHAFKEFEFIRNQPLIDAIYHKWELISYCLEDDDVPHPSEDPPLEFIGPVQV